MLTGSEIRRRFLDFFAARGHKVVPSSSLVPHGDLTLLFTNAGMNQFKDVFLGLEKRDYLRATTAQKCVRAGGKHNDLENVGFTHRHHTFFEMLGNFSFGDYFKDQAIALAWELLTSPAGYALPPDRLYATVYVDDDQAERIWRADIGLGPDRVFRLGAEENFWAMGDTGPCGPCSELHYDQGPEASEAGHADCRFPCDCGRYVEIWNLVFMQFERDGGGNMTSLPRPSIDTGAGLERLTAVLQGKRSNYDTDLFQPLIAAAGERAGVAYGASPRTDVALRILADHARSATFLVHDGVVPANEGRGYVLRKIIRRALRHGRALGLESAFLYSLAGLVADLMRDAYPDLDQSRARVASVLRAEEERFAHTLALALRELEPALQAARAELGGAEAFRLYDTFGLPLDMLREIASERGLRLDEAGFEAAMEEQRQRARRSWKGGEQSSAAAIYRDLAQAGPTRFEGYERTATADSIVRALLSDGAPVEAAPAGAELEVVLDHTPFYAASGGQIGDQGQFTTASGLAADVVDTYAPVSGLTVHRIRARQPLAVGEPLQALVDVARRDATRRNHTATHLLHAALRQVLGTHVKQAGSVVEPARLRFDFTHYAPLDSAQLDEVEKLVNAEILRNEPVLTEVLPLDQALSTGAMALFGEKYQENVRVVSVPGFSKELCGGTHCRRTGDIGLFTIAYEASVAAGVRRIEALTGEGAFAHLQQAQTWLREASALLRVPEPELPPALGRLLDAHRGLQEENDRLRMKAAQAAAAAGTRQRAVAGVAVLTSRADGLDRSQMRDLVDQLRARHPSAVVALGGVHDGKAALVVAVSKDLSGRLPAGKIIKAIPDATGGGRAEMAEGGARDPSRLDDCLEQVYAAVAEILAPANAPLTH